MLVNISYLTVSTPFICMTTFFPPVCDLSNVTATCDEMNPYYVCVLTLELTYVYEIMCLHSWEIHVSLGNSGSEKNSELSHVYQWHLFSPAIELCTGGASLNLSLP